MFMRDRINQSVLGLFLATFVYALVIMTTVGPVNEGGDVFVPRISVLVAFLLSFACFFLLVFFIHHVAEGIQADAIIADVGRGLDMEVDSLFPPEGAEEKDPDSRPARAAPADESQRRDICIDKSGYLQTVDFTGLAELCAECDVHLDLEVKPGDFLVDGHRIGTVWPRDRVDEDFDGKVLYALVTGPKRTPAQDLGFRVHALVEVALRALSAGINDTRTATACIDRLTASLARMMDHRAFKVDEATPGGDGRLSVKRLQFEDVFDMAFNEIRQSAQPHPAVIFRQIDGLAILAARASTETHRRVIRKHGEIFERLCDAVLTEPFDRETGHRKLEGLRRTLTGDDEAPASLQEENAEA